VSELHHHQQQQHHHHLIKKDQIDGVNVDKKDQPN